MVSRYRQDNYDISQDRWGGL